MLGEFPAEQERSRIYATGFTLASLLPLPLPLPRNVCSEAENSLQYQPEHLFIYLFNKLLLSALEPVLKQIGVGNKLNK